MKIPVLVDRQKEKYRSAKVEAFHTDQTCMGRKEKKWQ